MASNIKKVDAKKVIHHANSENLRCIDSWRCKSNAVHTDLRKVKEDAFHLSPIPNPRKTSLSKLVGFLTRIVYAVGQESYCQISGTWYAHVNFKRESYFRLTIRAVKSLAK